MQTEHPSSDILDRLRAGTLTPAEAKAAVEHLASACEPCLAYLRGVQRAADQTGEAGTVDAYAGAVAGLLARGAAGGARAQRGELAAAAAWTLLGGTPPAQRERLILGDRRFHSWELAMRLLESASEHHWRDSGRGIAECRLALAIAERLPEAVYPHGMRQDLKARALGALADALRLGDRLDDAAAHLRRAWQALGGGTGDPLERAELLRHEAGLRLTLGDFDAAAALLRPAASLFRLCRDRHQEGRTLQKLAFAVGHENPAQGVAMAERALELIDAGREPRLDLVARHLLIWFLNDSGEGWLALGLLKQSRPLYRQLGDSQPRLLLPWLEARICRQLGQLEAAERGLAGVWHDFHEAGFHQELTLVSLDLAEAYMAQGKTRHALRLLKTFHTTLGQWRMHPYGMAAWLLLVEAAAGEAGQARALTREAALYFRRSWRRPLPFARPAGLG